MDKVINGCREDKEGGFLTTTWSIGFFFFFFAQGVASPTLMCGTFKPALYWFFCQDNVHFFFRYDLLPIVSCDV